MEQRIFVLYSLLEDANALPISYTDVFDSKEEAKEAMTNWHDRLLEHGDTTIKNIEDSFNNNEREEVTEYIREWTMEWHSPTYEIHFSQVIQEFVKVNGKYQRVSHAKLK